MNDWYVLCSERQKWLNENKAYEKRNLCGFKFLLPFNIQNTKEKNAEIFIEKVEALSPSLIRAIAEGEREICRPDSHFLHTDSEQYLLMQVSDYIRSFQYTFNPVACKNSTEELPRKLYEYYQNLTYFQDTTANLTLKEKQYKEQEDLRMKIESITYCSHIEEETRITRMMRSYEQMVDPTSTYYRQWRSKQLTKIAAWKERALKEEEERHLREMAKIDLQRKKLEEKCEHEIGKHQTNTEEINHKAFERIAYDASIGACPPELYCKDCDYIAKTTALYNRHLLSKKHTTPRPSYFCEPCQYNARDKTDFDKHVDTNKHQRNVEACV